jgi:hypothetical protein
MFDFDCTRIPDTLYVKEVGDPVEVATTSQVRDVDAPQGLYISDTPEKESVVEDTASYPATVTTTLYSSITPIMIEGWVKTTTCYKKHSTKSSICKTCPIQAQCRTVKTVSLNAKNKKKREIKQLEERASKVGFSLKGVKLPDLENNITFYDCKFEIPCVLSGKPIVLGESFVHIKGFGAVKADTLDILKDYKEMK